MANVVPGSQRFEAVTLSEVSCSLGFGSIAWEGVDAKGQRQTRCGLGGSPPLWFETCP